MKKLIILIFTISIISCAQQPMDVQEAKTVVEELILKTDQEDFDAVEKLYSSDFNASEPMEAKKAKLLQLKKALGKVKNLELISSENVAEFGQPAKVILVYKVFHSKITSIETFSVVEDEGGYKVASYLVKSEGN